MTRSPLFTDIETYLAARRRDGYALTVQGSLLRSFARFIDEVGHRGPITVDVAVRWAKSTSSADPDHPARRLAVVRRFATYLAASDPTTQIPPTALLRKRPPAVSGPSAIPPTPLASRIEEYLAMRRGLGYQMQTQGSLLGAFARFADEVGHRGPVTIDLGVRWAQATRSTDPSQPTRRLEVVRGLAKHLAALEPGTEIPPRGLLGHATRRKPPHIYSDAEVSVLLRGARTLRPRQGLRSHTYVAFFSLLLCTGLRVGEACRLRGLDVDLDSGLLTIRQTKFGKSRLVPLHPDSARHLRDYVRQRDSCPHAPRSEFFFRTDHAPRLTVHAVDLTFWRMRPRLGWTAQGRARLPRIQDMRHTFVVRRLIRWYADGVDLDRRILDLSTYLGHVDVSSTYWYITAIPELMALAAERFEHGCRDTTERES